jgi:hypothetical protein
MKQGIEESNRPVMLLEDTHPAKRFLRAFDECLADCGGCELALYETPVDQEWLSATDGQVWKFSTFVYKYLAFDIVLDGFITNAPRLTMSEKSAINDLPRYRLLMAECAHAARQCDNTDCLELVEIVVNMLAKWEDYLDFRRKAIS